MHISEFFRTFAAKLTFLLIIDNSDYTTSYRIKHVNRKKHMARINMSYKQILEHLERIDKYLQMPYREFDITPYLGKSIDDIAYAMMMHVGLHDYRPVIEYDRLDGKTGGYIELNNNPDKSLESLDVHTQ